MEITIKRYLELIEENDALYLIAFVSEIVAAYISNHEMRKEDIPGFIQMVHRSLLGVASNKSFSLSALSAPAVPIEESIKPDYIVCLEDGRKMRMLKRHLKTTYNMTPEQYRERWNLPVNYPMVAQDYTKRRQNIAKSIGLGTHKKGQKKAAA